VDYVKSGQPAELEKHLIPRKWPHFMEKHHKPKEQIYTSTKILGQLYDKVETVNFIPQWEHKFDPRILSACPKDDAMLKVVRQTKTQYDTAMRRILANQEIGSEFEVWTTFILKKPRAGNDYKYQEEVARLSAALKDHFRALCMDKAGGKDFEVLKPFVAGMYKVTKEELDIALAECRATKTVAGREVPKRKMKPKSMPLISFPWLFEKELGRIATGMDIATLMEEQGLFVEHKYDGATKKRNVTSHIADFDDFVQQEDGVIVHRGEQLDLFRPDLVDLSDDEYVDEERNRDKELHTITDLAIRDSDSDSENDRKGKTGVEDVVQPAILQGLIGSEEAARRLLEHSSALPSTFGKTASDPLQNKIHAARPSTVAQEAVHDSSSSDKQSSPGRSSHSGSVDASTPITPATIPDTVEQTMVPAEEAGLFEPEDASDVEPEAEAPAAELDNFGLEHEDNGEEIEIEEEIEELEIEESPMERLARMQRR
jgi:RNA-dependent RNA polymerase